MLSMKISVLRRYGQNIHRCNDCINVKLYETRFEETLVKLFKLQKMSQQDSS